MLPVSFSIGLTSRVMVVTGAVVFLKSLSDIEIKSILITENRIHDCEQDSKIKHEDINEYLNYILYDGNDYGLKNEAEEILIFKKIKETFYLYKKIKLTKLSQRT